MTTDAGSAAAPEDHSDVTDLADTGSGDAGPADQGFVASLLRDATITGLPGDTGAPPAEQEDDPVGSEPRTGDDPDGGD